MAVPILIPLLIAGAAAAFALSQRESQPKQSTPVQYTLDSNLPPQLRDYVLRMLAYERDPVQLEGLGSALAPFYPKTSAALFQKAATLRSTSGATAGAATPPYLPHYPQQSPPQKAPPTGTGQYPTTPPIRDTPPAATTPPTGKTPPQTSIPTPWGPVTLPNTDEPGGQGMPGLPPGLGQGPPSAEQPETPPGGRPPGPAHRQPPQPPTMAETPPLAGLDPGMPPEMQKAVLGALTSETNPERLEGFATAIQGQYPIAAGLLMGKAQALRAAAKQPPATPTATPAPVPTPPTSVATYRVLEGDFPIKITKKFTGDGSRWKELIAANPHKKKKADGNFATLYPGEILNIPPTWPRLPLAATPAGGAYPTQGTPNIPPNWETPPLRDPPPQPPIGPIPTAPPPQPMTLPISTVSPSLPIVGAQRTYTVKPGDSAYKISTKLTGNGNRWKELVAANPHKTKAPDGNFKYLNPNEILAIPASWPAATVPIYGGANA